MAFQMIIEWVAHGLEAMGIAVVAVGGAAAMITFVRRLIAETRSKSGAACSGSGWPAPRC
jgi:hypothetical protein